MINSAQVGNVIPTGYIILDNSGGKFTEYCTENNVDLPDTVTVIEADHNIGCEPGWNFMMRVLLNHIDRNALAVIVNDDILFHETSIETLVYAALSDFMQWEQYQPIYCAGGIDAPNAFSLFLTHPETLFTTVGPFNSSFAPAYHADNDMYYRLRLLGYDLVRVADCTAEHGEGSATIKTYSEQEELTHHKRFQYGRDLYIRMWGGNPHEETYKVMFNGEDIMRHMVELARQYGN
jgi:GT2 family glycosyltransferase